MSKAELKAKLRDKLRQKRLGRTNKDTRENKLEYLYEKLENTKKKEEKARIRREIQLLEDIDNKEFNDLDNSEFPDYGE